MIPVFLPRAARRDATRRTRPSARVNNAASKNIIRGDYRPRSAVNIGAVETGSPKANFKVRQKINSARANNKHCRVGGKFPNFSKADYVPHKFVRDLPSSSPLAPSSRSENGYGGNCVREVCKRAPHARRKICFARRDEIPVCAHTGN